MRPSPEDYSATASSGSRRGSRDGSQIPQQFSAECRSRRRRTTTETARPGCTGTWVPSDPPSRVAACRSRARLFCSGRDRKKIAAALSVFGTRGNSYDFYRVSLNAPSQPGRPVVPSRRCSRDDGCCFPQHPRARDRNVWSHRRRVDICQE